MAHYDSLKDPSPRLATAILYLRDAGLVGGETTFPHEASVLDPMSNLLHSSKLLLISESLVYMHL